MSDEKKESKFVVRDANQRELLHVTHAEIPGGVGAFVMNKPTLQVRGAYHRARSVFRGPCPDDLEGLGDAISFALVTAGFETVPEHFNVEKLIDVDLLNDLAKEVEDYWDSFLGFRSSSSI